MSKVALNLTKHKSYSTNPPYSKEDNPLYQEVEKLLLDLGLDKENPFKDIIKPGQTVLIKPCLTTHKRHMNAIISHPAVIRPLIDFAWTALKGQGEIIIADGPCGSGKFDTIVETSGLKAMVEYLQQKEKYNIQLYCLKDNVEEFQGNYGVKLVDRSGDPRGYTTVDLKTDSAYMEIINNHKRFSSTAFPFKYAADRHTPKKNQYEMPNSVLQADCVISVSKLKTHKKCGVTLALKNMIGITNKRAWVPHFQKGAPPKGDEFPISPSWYSLIGKRLWYNSSPLAHQILRLAYKFYRSKEEEASSTCEAQPKKNKKNSVSGANWPGSDTIWRAVLDLNRILLYANKQGEICKTKQRNYFCVLDGIVAGELDGPLDPAPKPAGMLLAGFDPVAVDVIGTEVMGFDHEKIKTTVHIDQSKGEALGENNINNISTVGNVDKSLNLNFVPPHYWKEIIKS